MRPRLTSIGLLAIAILAGGCGLTNPYQGHATRQANSTTVARPNAVSTSTSTSTQTDTGDPAPERGGTISRSARARQDVLPVTAESRTAVVALERYAHLYVNWQAADLAAHQRALAAISLDQARAQALQAATSSAKDPELTRSHVTNHGQLIAITHGQGPAHRQWVLVTRETTSGQGQYAGLPPTLHVTYATVTHATVGWVVTTWAPQT